jgi:AcrR family transcriptional regulator
LRQSFARALPLRSGQVHRVLLRRDDLELAAEPMAGHEQEALERLERRLAQPALDEAHGVLGRACAQGELRLADALPAAGFAHERGCVDHDPYDTACGMALNLSTQGVNGDSLLRVPYRPTERTEARRFATREAIVDAAHELIARGGYREAQVAAVAERAGAATGTVYRHFPSKAELFAEVFRRASQHEVDVTRAAGAAAGPRALDRLAAAVEAFARRATRGRRLAWALIAEPVDPAVEAERLVFRRAYAAVFAEILEEGLASGELPPQNVALTAAALVGALGEALVGPLSPVAGDVDPDALVADLKAFAMRSVTGLVG